MGHNNYAPLGDSMKICEEFIIHDQLNPKLFDKDNNLKQVVVEKLLAISEQFKEYIEIPLEILDIQLVGSNASYNYTNTSDIDLHIITNFELLDCNGELLQALYNESFDGEFGSHYAHELFHTYHTSRKIEKTWGITFKQINFNHTSVTSFYSTSKIRVEFNFLLFNESK